MDPSAERILRLIQQQYPEEGAQLALSGALIQADFPLLEAIRETPPPRPYLNDFLDAYALQKKSTGRAQLYNALLPGAGYLYLGQRQTATTAFLLNGLFIAASTYFFIDGNIPAGIIFGRLRGRLVFWRDLWGGLRG